MKKFLLGLVALVALSLTACNGFCEKNAEANDTIEDTTVVVDSTVSVDSVAVLDTVAK